MREATGLLLRSPTGETFWFDPGAFCLEFVLTGGEGSRAVYETLHAPGDLERWIAEVVGVEVEGVTDGDLRDARRVREAIWQLADARIEGRPLPPVHVAEINRAAASPPLTPQIDDESRRRLATPATSSQVLSTVARDAVELFTGPLGSRLRRCEGSNCTLVFTDTSRPGRRRWCSMERCGNRAKVSAFRNRQRKEDT